MRPPPSKKKKNRIKTDRAGQNPITACILWCGRFQSSNALHSLPLTCNSKFFECSSVSLVLSPISKEVGFCFVLFFKFYLKYYKFFHTFVMPRRTGRMSL